VSDQINDCILIDADNGSDQGLNPLTIVHKAANFQCCKDCATYESTQSSDLRERVMR
jgi:hypothetical protein